MQRTNSSHGEHGAEHQHDHHHDHVGHAHHDHGGQAVASGAAEYTCPMHPEVRQAGPGKCPKCGMFLEPVGAPSTHAHGHGHSQAQEHHGRPHHHAAPAKVAAAAPTAAVKGGEGRRVHVPDAPGNPSDGPRQLPHLRNGARARHRHW